MHLFPLPSPPSPHHTPFFDFVLALIPLYNVPVTVGSSQHGVRGPALVRGEAGYISCYRKEKGTHTIFCTGKMGLLFYFWFAEENTHWRPFGYRMAAKK